MTTAIASLYGHVLQDYKYDKQLVVTNSGTQQSQRMYILMKDFI